MRYCWSSKKLNDNIQSFLDMAFKPLIDCINAVSYTHLVFGSNHLFIGKAIYNILNELEKRYGLDFDKMEEELDKSEE